MGETYVLDVVAEVHRITERSVRGLDVEILLASVGESDQELGDFSGDQLLG